MAKKIYEVAPGQKFGFWTVLDIVPFTPSKALCRCICGNEREVNMSYLATGASKSCGCAKGVNTVEEYIERRRKRARRGK